MKSDTPTSVDNTPAFRFLNRGQQLNRVQQRVLAQMYSEVEAEKSALPSDIKTPEEGQDLVAKVLSGMAKSDDRWADIDLTLQLFYCRHVDNFQIFLEEILRAILNRHPGLLKRSEAVPMDQILAHSTMDDFIQSSIDRHIHQLAYKSIHDFSQLLHEQTGFRLFSSSKTTADIEKIYALRNLIVHNYGIINKLYLSRFADPNLKLGKAYPFTQEEIKGAWQTLITASGDIQNRARQKFKLFTSGA